MSLFKVQTAEWIINLEYALLIIGLIQLLHPLNVFGFQCPTDWLLAKAS